MAIKLNIMLMLFDASCRRFTIGLRLWLLPQVHTCGYMLWPLNAAGGSLLAVLTAVACSHRREPMVERDL